MRLSTATNFQDPCQFYESTAFVESYADNGQRQPPVMK
jgi:hypothetical protein